MTVEERGWRMEQTGFRISAINRHDGTVHASDVFEVEAAARDCAQYLLKRGWRVSAALLKRELYDNEVIAEEEEPISWAGVETT